MEWIFKFEKASPDHNGAISRDFSLWIRCFCCLLIVFHHYGHLVFRISPDSNYIFRILANWGGIAGVGVFFFLSGYGISESYRIRPLSISQILKQRYWKLIWPILIVNSIYLIVRYFLGMNQIDSLLSLGRAIVNFKSVDGALWFIEVLFFCYAIYYLYGLIKLRLLKGHNSFKITDLLILGFSYLLFHLELPKLSKKNKSTHGTKL